jgi:hypothetical protein
MGRPFSKSSGVMGVGLEIIQGQNWLFRSKETKRDGITGDRVVRGMLVPWDFIDSATGERRAGVKPRPLSEQVTLDQILSHMRNQECENKAIKKLLETHSQDMTKVRKETKDFKEKVEITEPISGVIKDVRCMEQALEKWDSWQQEIDNKVDWLEEGKIK